MIELQDETYSDLLVANQQRRGIKTELKAAKVYAEGRGIRIEVRNKSKDSDIQKLIKFKITI